MEATQPTTSTENHFTDTHLHFNGKAYTLTTLPKQIQELINLIRSADINIAQLSQQLTFTQTARQVYLGQVDHEMTLHQQKQKKAK